MQFFWYVDEIVEWDAFVISEVCSVVVKTESVDNLNWKNACSWDHFLSEFIRENFNHLKLLFKFSSINIITDVDFEVF